jgi:hypothetical protein
MNALRKREGKRPLTQEQIEQVKRQVTMREHLGRYTLFPEDLERELAKEEATT